MTTEKIGGVLSKDVGNELISPEFLQSMKDVANVLVEAPYKGGWRITHKASGRINWTEDSSTAFGAARPGFRVECWAIQGPTFEVRKALVEAGGGLSRPAINLDAYRSGEFVYRNGELHPYQAPAGASNSSQPIQVEREPVCWRYRKPDRHISSLKWHYTEDSDYVDFLREDGYQVVALYE